MTQYLLSVHLWAAVAEACPPPRDQVGRDLAGARRHDDWTWV